MKYLTLPPFPISEDLKARYEALQRQEMEQERLRAQHEIRQSYHTHKILWTGDWKTVAGSWKGKKNVTPSTP